MADERTTATPAEQATAPVPKARAAQPEPTEGQPNAPAAKKSAKKAAAKKTPAKAAPAKKAATKKAAAEKAAAEKAPAKKPAKATKKSAPKSAPEVGLVVAPGQDASRPAEPAAPVATKPVLGEPMLPEPELAGATTAPGAWADALLAVVRAPGQPPRQLAELAVAELGPRAADWVAWLRRTYPGAPAAGIARLATQEAGRHDLAVTLISAAGPAAAPFCLPAAGWVRVLVVLRIAAAHGHDPTAPERAGELLDLFGAGAEVSTGAGALRWLDTLRFTSGKLKLRRKPAAGVLRLLIAASEHGDGVTRLAHRANLFYRRARS